MSSVGALRCRADFCLPLWGEGGVSCSASVSEGSLSPCWDPVSPINSLRNLNLDKNNCQTTYHPFTGSYATANSFLYWSTFSSSVWIRKSKHKKNPRVNMECWGKAAWFFLCEIQMKPRKEGQWCSNCITQRRSDFQFWTCCGIPVQSCKIILLLCPYWFENRMLSHQNMGTNLELGYHHGERCLYSNA